MTQLSKTQRDTLIAAVSMAVGAAGGQFVPGLDNPGLLTADEVVQIQQERRTNQGSFEQVLPGGVKPSDAADQRRVANFPENMRVDVYTGPEGSGYTIVKEEAGKRIFISHGPEAADRSRVIDIATTTATSSTLSATSTERI